jgi:hypothetical protein
MRLEPGASLAAAAKRAPGERIILTAGAYAGGVISGVRKLHLQAEGIVILTGGAELKIENCGEVVLEDFEVHKSRTHGVRVIGCESLRAVGLRLQSSTSNGLLTANTPHVEVLDCESRDSVDGHGFYLSQSGDHLLIRDCTAHGNARAGIQVNAVEGRPKKRDVSRDGISQDVQLLRNVLTGNQTRYGGAALNLAGCRGVIIQGNRIEAHRGRHGIALWDDEAGAEFACRDVAIEGNSVSFAPGFGSANVSVGKTCQRVSVGRNAWAVGAVEVSRG